MKRIDVESNHKHAKSRMVPVLAALAIPIVLALLLVTRFASTSDHPATEPQGVTHQGTGVIQPPKAEVPEPKPFDPAKLTLPCWSCRENQGWAIRFKTDLDLLAPLGTGTVNAALWFKDFSKTDGSRRDEAKRALDRRVLKSGMKILTPDDPLLLEAEPWCNMAEMKFYPDIYSVRGYDTRIPNLLIAAALANSWVARGYEATDPGLALDDFRRVIRLGRLLRQDDLILITDLVGLHCIRVGAQGIYDTARKEGNVDLTLLSSVVLSEVAPQRLQTAEKVSEFDISAYIHPSFLGGFKVDVPKTALSKLLRIATESPDRRFVAEALVAMNVIRYKGTSDQQERVNQAFDKLLKSKDPITRQEAQWFKETKATDESIKAYLIKME